MTDIWNGMQQTGVWEDVTPEQLHNHIIPRNQPAILRGFASDWPIVGQSDEQLFNQLSKYNQQKSVATLSGGAEMQGRFFFDKDFRSFNFESKNMPLETVFQQLLDYRKQKNPPHLYAAPIHVADVLPGLSSQIPVPHLEHIKNKAGSLWIGNRTKIAAHWDQQDNIAVVVHGKRRFTLLPPEQISNLYIGPLDATIAGRPISMVDFNNPDFQQHPKFRDAIKEAQMAVLAPGDALYIPSMWFHHVESLEDIGVLYNIWWRESSTAKTENPFHTLVRSLMSISHMPQPERQAWKALYDHFIFQEKSNLISHLPEESRGVLKHMTPQL